MFLKGFVRAWLEFFGGFTGLSIHGLLRNSIFKFNGHSLIQASRVLLVTPRIDPVYLLRG